MLLVDSAASHALLDLLERICNEQLSQPEAALSQS
jgi:hypothetical protein